MIIKSIMIKNSFQILISDLEAETTPLIEQAISSFRNSLKECSYTLYNKEMIQEFLALEFDNEVLNAFEKLKPFAFKADLARYCIAYKYGGWYADITLKFIKNIDGHLDDIEFLGFTDLGGGITPNQLPYAIQSSLFYSSKNSIIMEKAIQIILENCRNNYYGVSPTSITGPGVLGRAFAYYAFKRNHIIGHFIPLTPNHKNQNRSYVLPDGAIVALHKDAWVLNAKGGQINEFGFNEGNNYFEMFVNKDVYN